VQLEQRQGEIVLDVGLRMLKVVRALLRAVGAPAPDPTLNVVPQFLLSREQSLLEQVSSVKALRLEGLGHRHS
jgi:hypothetical protein